MSLLKISIMAFSISFSLFSRAALAKDFPGDSLYQIRSTWVDQNGKSVLLADLSGGPVIVSMVYLSCHYICPTVISEVQSIEAKLDAKVKDKVKILLVSFDPKRDTEKTMKAYSEKRKLDLKRWKIITQKSESRIREFAAALDFKYQKGDDGEFTHSFVIAVLDGDGVIRARVDAAAQDHAPLVSAINKMFP